MKDFKGDDIQGIGAGAPKKNIKSNNEINGNEKLNLKNSMKDNVTKKIKDKTEGSLTDKGASVSGTSDVKNLASSLKNIKNQGLKGASSDVAKKALVVAGSKALTAYGVPPVIADKISKFGVKYGIKITKTYIKIFLFVSAFLLVSITSFLIAFITMFTGLNSQMSAIDKLYNNIATPNVKSSYYLSQISKDLNINYGSLLMNLSEGDTLGQALIKQNPKFSDSELVISKISDIMKKSLSEMFNNKVISKNYYEKMNKTVDSDVRVLINQKNVIFSITNEFIPQVWDQAIIVASGESGLRADAVNNANNDGSQDIGLYQLNTGNGLTGTIFSAYEQINDSKCTLSDCITWAVDPSNAAKAGFNLWKSCGWDKWAYAKSVGLGIYGTENYCDKTEINVSTRKNQIALANEYIKTKKSDIKGTIALESISLVGTKVVIDGESTPSPERMNEIGLLKKVLADAGLETQALNTINDFTSKILKKIDLNKVTAGDIVIIRYGNLTKTGIVLDSKGEFVVTSKDLIFGAISVSEFSSLYPDSVLEYYTI